MTYTTPDWTVEADFDGDGTYEFDLTPYANVLGGGLTTDRGLQPDGSYRVSEMALGLDNNTGIFTPEYASSPLYGQVRPHVPVRLTCLHNAVSYTRWTGYLQDWKYQFGQAGSLKANVVARDIFSYLADSDPVDVACVPRDTDGALTAIATAIGLVAGDLDFDDGVQDLALHFCVGQPAMQAMGDAVRSEMGGNLWATALGKLRFESRISRLGTTVDDTWGDGTLVQPESIQYQFDPYDIITGVTARATAFIEQAADTPIFEFSEELTLTAGQVWERTFQANSAYLTLTTIAANTDYLANATSGGGGTDKTSALTVTVTDLGGGRFTLNLRNTDAGTIYVTKLRLRGHPVVFFSDRPAAEVSLSVPGMKAGQAVQFDVPFAGDTGGQILAYAMQEMRVGRYAFPRVTLTFGWDNDTTAAAMLTAELGDLIRFADKAGGGASFLTNVDDWWYIERIREQVVPAQPVRTSVTLVPSYVYRNLDAIVFDTFDRANVSNDLGTSFSEDVWAGDGNMDIASNTARANSDTLQMPYLDLGASKTDQVVEVSLAAVGAGDEVGVVFRYADANNQYRAYIDKGDNKVHLEKNVATVVTEISAPAYTVGTTAEIRVINQSTRIRVWVDRKLYIDTTDSALSAGTKVGLFARNASGTTTFNDFFGQSLI